VPIENAGVFQRGGIMEDKKIEDKKRLNISIDAELHKQLKIAAAEHGTTIGDLVSEAIENKLDNLKVTAEKN